MKNYQQKVAEIIPQINFQEKKFQIRFATTLGEILLDLYPDKAPEHAKNIIALTKAGFYDGIKFHRVISGFMIQAGCPMGSGVGGPGYTIKAEFNDVPHVAGTLSMARTNDPHSAGSQFFLCLGRVAHLDKQYTVFGKTANQESLDVVLKIGQVPTGYNDVPKEDVVIQKADVVESGLS